MEPMRRRRIRCESVLPSRRRICWSSQRRSATQQRSSAGPRGCLPAAIPGVDFWDAITETTQRPGVCINLHLIIQVGQVPGMPSNAISATSFGGILSRAHYAAAPWIIGLAEPVNSATLPGTPGRRKST